MRFICGGLALTHKKGRFSERPRPRISPVRRGLLGLILRAEDFHTDIPLTGRLAIQGFRVVAHRNKVSVSFTSADP